MLGGIRMPRVGKTRIVPNVAASFGLPAPGNQGRLSAGVSRAGVAAQVLASPEALRMKTTNFYVDVLGRTPDFFGMGYWSARLQAGSSPT